MPLFSSSIPIPESGRSAARWPDARTLGQLLLAALCIAALSKLSRVALPESGSFSLFWPSAGIGLALLARFGRWGLASVALGVGLWASLGMGWSASGVLWAVAAACAGPWLTWRLLQKHLVGVAYPFARTRPVLAFLRLSATGSLLGAVVGSVGLWASGLWPAGAGAFAVVLAYWMIEVTGACLFAPVAWDVVNASRLPAQAPWPRRVWQACVRDAGQTLAVLGLTLAVTGLLVAGQGNYARALLYGLLPLLVMVALQATPLLVRLLVLGSGVLVLGTMAHLRSDGIAPGNDVELLLVSLYMLVGTATLAVLLATSVEKRQALERLEQQAFVDAQTGLLNEAGVLRHLEEITAQEAQRRQPRRVAVIGVALSNARQAASLTDQAWLLALDSQLAGQLRHSAPDVRWARTAGGRFLGVWVDEGQSLEEAVSQIALATVPLAPQDPDTASQASAFTPRWSVAAVHSHSMHRLPLQAILSALAQAESHAQQFRRTEVTAVSEDFLAALQQDARRVERVRQAIEGRQLLLYAQPIVPNRSGAARPMAPASGEPVHKFEVLVRLAGDDGQPLPPGEFLEAAMRAGLMTQLDMAVVEQTFAWLAEHPQAMAQVQGCGINLSGPTVGDAGTVEVVRELFERYRIPPGIVIFEITESLAVTDPEVAAQTLRALRGMGARVAIDDFGTGVATFDYLKRFEVDFIKIDGSFIRALQEDALDRVIVTSMVNVARSLGVRTVAEFVSNPTLRELVTELGIDESQGHAISAARPIADWFDRA